LFVNKEVLRIKSDYMRTSFILIFFLCFYQTVLGQQKQGPESFVIKGQLVIGDISEYMNVSNKVRIDYTDQFDQTHSDSTEFNEEGIFFIETDKIVTPTRINLVFDFDSFNDIMAAPGYELTFYKPSKSKRDFKLTGKGSRSSNYYKILDSIPASRFYSIVWWDMNESDFIRLINKTQQVRDSVAHIIFDKDSPQDNYLDYFGKMVRLDNKFEKLKYLFLYAEHKKYSLEQTISFVRKNFDQGFFSNLSNEDYLISSEFRSGISYHRPDAYLNYLLLSDNPSYTSAGIDKIPVNELLEKANAVFSGEVRAFVLYKIIEFPIWTNRTIEDLNKYRDQFSSYYPSITDGSKNALDNIFLEKTKRLAVEEREMTSKETLKANAIIDKPAPYFTLKNRSNKAYKLEDFKGKVVVLDLWSSWCDLCRVENTALRKLYRKYKNDKKIAFVGVGVLDDFDEWEKAVKKDRPAGIQLFDKDKAVYESYIDEHIPRFVVIDKKGNVANFNAPKPSSGDDLEKLIKSEIKK
jgi:peroxiredoxin